MGKSASKKSHQSIAWLERAAKAENQWVRAVVLQKDHVAHGDARRIALEATEMARKALGESHALHAVALLNLGMYFEVVEKSSAEANRLYKQALHILGRDHSEYAEAMYWLGVYQFKEENARCRAAEVWSESLEILKRRSDQSTRMADLLVCLSAVYINDEPKKAAQQLQQALEIQRKRLGPRHAAVRDTEARLAAALRTVGGIK